MRLRSIGFLAVAGLAATAAVARAEVKEVVLAQQFGGSYLPMMIMEHMKLVEKHLAASGMSDTKVTWARLGGPSALNDALLSGNLHFSPQGVPSLGVIWDRTRNGIGVKAVSAIASNNLWLNTRNPNIRALTDFTEKDRIAVPSLKVSTQALLMAIASEKAFGKGKHGQLDHIIVALPHPDALIAVLNPTHEINSHFATTPFHEAEIKGGLRTITHATEIMGGLPTGLTWCSTTKFRAENPKAYAAVGLAFEEALAWIDADKRRAGRKYLELSNDKKLTEDDMNVMLTSGELVFQKTPAKIGAFVDFMHKVGLIKTKAESWKDLFFPEIHNLPGS